MVHFNHFYYQYRYVRCVHCRLLNPNGYVGRIFKRLTSLNSSHQGEKLHFAAILVVKIGKVKTVAVHEQGHKLLFLSEISITDLFPSILPHCVRSPHKTILGRGSEINHGTQQEKELLRIIPFYLFICI